MADGATSPHSTTSPLHRSFNDRRLNTKLTECCPSDSRIYQAISKQIADTQ